MAGAVASNKARRIASASCPRAGVIGLPVAGCTLKLVPSGKKLEVRVKGPNVTPGYYKHPELTAAAFDEALAKLRAWLAARAACRRLANARHGLRPCGEDAVEQEPARAVRLSPEHDFWAIDHDTSTSHRYLRDSHRPLQRGLSPRPSAT